MTSFYYYDQNPSGFCFLVQIRSSVINLAGITNLNMKGKTKRVVVVLVKRRHLANGLLQSNYSGLCCHFHRTLFSKKLELVFKILRTVYCETDNMNLSSLIKILAEKV